MDEYAGRVLAGRYRLPVLSSDSYESGAETRAFDTYSGQEVLVRQVPLPEVVEAEVLDADGLPEGFRPEGEPGRETAEPTVARAVEAVQAAARIPDHPGLDQVFDVFAEGGSLWIVSELVAARPLSALLARGPLSPYRAAEVAADVLTALRALHAHGWVHRNVTARTVLVCDDGRVMLTGLAVGAAEEALCGYDVVPAFPDEVDDFVDEAEPVPGVGDYRAARAGAVAAYRAGAVAGRAAPAGAALPVQPSRWRELIPEADGDHGSGLRPGPRASNAGGAVSAERSRQVRMTVVGPVTERWAPEQAHPVQENWQLAAPVGPATDLWALGALLFRAVQGHAPYPEESTPELVRMVCAEPPAFAEECGPVRPVVESLLRQDPTERLDIEELRGWLRSLVRSAPEPEAGANVIPAPPFDAGRLPVVRRRGELVRKRRVRVPATSAQHGRHKRGRAVQRAPRPARAPRERRPRSLGRWLLVLILLALVGAVAYAMVFMPKAGQGTGAGAAGARQENAVGGAPSASSEQRGEPSPEPSKPAESPGGKRSSTPSSTEPQSDVAPGFVLREDDAGFEVAVAKGWQRTGKNGRGQVVYAHGAFELIVVPGRDSTATYGKDPMKYQREDERELQPFRDSTWATSSGMKSIDVGGRTMAEGQFTWQGSDGREMYVRNLAMVIGGKYHVVQVRGPEAERDEVTRLYQQAYSTYRHGG
ncbi:serine/threonine protein kinase [Streptomyces sp. NPDC051684]|uniref:serine/threonine protein kinase n=1 Tax=Streptomyces sp. NPDC051684 TaxID=3365670 RepID=UPI0037A25969